MRRITVITLSFLLIGGINSSGQRIYKSSSVLSSGTWSKIAIKESGVYKVDAAFLATLGFPGSNISSASIRLYGNGGSMLRSEEHTSELQSQSNLVCRLLLE